MSGWGRCCVARRQLCPIAGVANDVTAYQSYSARPAMVRSCRADTLPIDRRGCSWICGPPTPRRSRQPRLRYRLRVRAEADRTPRASGARPLLSRRLSASASGGRPGGACATGARSKVRGIRSSSRKPTVRAVSAYQTSPTRVISAASSPARRCRIGSVTSPWLSHASNTSRVVPGGESFTAGIVTSGKKRLPRRVPPTC
jgi:hypothetical protein